MIDFNEVNIISTNVTVNKKKLTINYQDKRAGKIILNKGKFENVTGWFLSIELNKKSRNLGIGTIGMLKFLLNNNIEVLYANVRKSNIPSIKLLEKIGFKKYQVTTSGQLIYRNDYDKLTGLVELLNKVNWSDFYSSVLIDLISLCAIPAKQAIRIPYKNNKLDLLTIFEDFARKDALDICYDNQFVIISKEKNAQLIHEVDLSSEKHVKQLGKLLGYPNCCVNFMNQYDENEIDKVEYDLSRKRNYKGYWKLINPKNYRLGNSLVSHVSCSEDCFNSLVYAVLVLIYMKKMEGRFPFFKSLVEESELLLT